MFRRRGGKSSDEDKQDRLDEGLDLDEALGDELEAEAAEEAVPEDTEADLESQAADYMADNDTWLYGENAEDVLEILDFLEEIEPFQASAIAEEWRAAPKSDRDQARKAVRKILEGEGERPRQVRMAREEIGAWLAVAADYPEFTKAVPDWSKTCSVVSESALDAVTAIILEDDIDEMQYQALTSPWNDALDSIEIQEELEEVEEELADVEAGEDEDGEFGPNSDAVHDFMNRLWLLTPEQIARLVSGWEQQPEEDLRLAHDALKDLIEDEDELRKQIKAAQDKIAPWLNGGRITDSSSFLGQTGQATSRSLAGPALADTASALVVGDLLSPEDAEILYAPWFNLVGAPPLPEPAEEIEQPKAKAKASKAAAKPAAKPAAKAATKPAAKAAAKPATKPATKPAAKAATKPATKAAANPATKPAAKAATKPAAKPATKAAAKAAPQPAAKPVTKIKRK